MFLEAFLVIAAVVGLYAWMHAGGDRVVVHAGRRFTRRRDGSFLDPDGRAVIEPVLLAGLAASFAAQRGRGRVAGAEDGDGAASGAGNPCDAGSGDAGGSDSGGSD